MSGPRELLRAQAASLQNAYPQIYLACHVEHIRRRSHVSALSSGDASILAHLSFDGAVTAGRLARHLGIAASSLSARLKHLEKLGYVRRTAASGDRRVARIELTEKGMDASSAASVLDTQRVIKLLEQLKEADRKTAVNGLALLATAAARMTR